ncbi:ribonuclease H-like domain, reverse transcriptase, RNA-dependent DNA polymerase, partial [Tanacetum coccineum]
CQFLHDDWNFVSLVCHKWNEIDCLTRKHVTLHVRYAPTPSRLFKRFPSLESLTLKGIKNSNTSIDLTQWIREIAIKFTRLKSLHIRHLVIRDSDLEFLAKKRGKDLLSLKISECKGFSENGLMCVAKYCSELRELCLEGIGLVVGDEEVEEHGKWLRVLALRKTGIENFSHRYDAITALFGQEDVMFLVERYRESLVSLRVDTCLMHYAAQAITNVVNLQDFFGAIFCEHEQYIGFKLPSSIHSLGLSDMPQGSIQFVDHLLNQLRELNFRLKDVPQKCQCLFLQSCPNLEILYTKDAYGDTGLELISQVCKKLRKLTVDSGTRVGLMVVTLGCPNWNIYMSYSLIFQNEALECI